MSWRSVIISKPAYLSYQKCALLISQTNGQEKQTASVPLEDLSVIIIENAQVNITAQLLSAIADRKIVIFTCNAFHLPNGVFLPYLPHSRLLKVMRAQLALSVPLKKKLWQRLIQQKIFNQSAVLRSYHYLEAAEALENLSLRVLSGDSNNSESRAAKRYFSVLFGSEFSREKPVVYNAALNYAYAIVRGAIARTLCAYGFLPAFGVFHRNEQNPFNLADDLIEPYRPLIDAHVIKYFPSERYRLNENIPAFMTAENKAELVKILGEDIILNGHLAEKSYCTLLSAIEASVISLSQIIFRKKNAAQLTMPVIQKFKFSV